MNEIELQEKINEYENIEDLQKNKDLRGEVIDFIHKKIHSIKFFNQKLDGTKKNIHFLKIPLPHDEELLKKAVEHIKRYQDIIDKDFQPLIEKDNAKLIPEEYYQDLSILESLFINQENIKEDKETLKNIMSIYLEGDINNG